MKYKSMIYKENKEDTFGSSILEEDIIWQEIFSSMDKAEENRRKIKERVKKQNRKTS